LVAERDVVITPGGAVIVDGEAEVVDLAGGQAHVTFTASELAGEYHAPGVAILAAFRADQGGAAFHDPCLGDMPVVGLVLAAAPLVEVVVHAVGQRAILDVLGLLFVAAGHGAYTAVAAAPAAALFGQLNLAAVFQQVGD